MTNIKFQLMNADDVLKENSGEDETYLEFHHHYKKGDFYRVEVSASPCYLMVQMDSAIRPALIYVKTNIWDFHIPSNDQREWPYAPLAFQSRNNYASVKYVNKDEALVYRNLAENSHDQHEKNSGFPHVFSNAETRGEYVFYCKNAIDGIIANESHGNYPFQSWGINMQNDAEMTLDYGREVLIDKISFLLRADYPHDSHWTSVSIEFSDGSIQTFNLKKTKDKQSFDIDSKKITWIKLFNLIKDKDASTFPDLTQFETYGRDVID